jgi:hypothetical protein
MISAALTVLALITISYLGSFDVLPYTYLAQRLKRILEGGRYFGVIPD